LDGGKPSPNDIQRNKDLDKSNVWGERSYYYHCHRDGGDFHWFADNLTAAPGAPKPEQINAAWTFRQTWNPENSTGAVIKKISNREGQFAVDFSENVTVKGKPRLKLSTGNFTEYISGSGSDSLTFRSPDESADAVSVDLNGGFIVACQASATTRMAELPLPPSSKSAKP
jgi:pectinesterase